LENQKKIYDLEEHTALFAEGVRDFKMKINLQKRIEESAYWLRLVITDGSSQQESTRTYLRQDAKEFILIYSYSKEAGVVVK